eukprot:CAMPEP_0206144362 /NCGR_PEP_ID=MMETSP1473-20131121/23851_1 /ASSEMBLY_ACC=CAM_ASM_001109 /TAXON_ID=1461547 /ORGANISM="Stichococcus sp, Strain RCC1054" /LENGTH=161 /DNA_ID=CAMNT_0053540171 /DNA_START=195 /DNA_END=677 /DNA_ORIENTATION=-
MLDCGLKAGAHILALKAAACTVRLRGSELHVLAFKAATCMCSPARQHFAHPRHQGCSLQDHRLRLVRWRPCGCWGWGDGDRDGSRKDPFTTMRRGAVVDFPPAPLPAPSAAHAAFGLSVASVFPAASAALLVPGAEGPPALEDFGPAPALLLALTVAEALP